MWIFLRSLTFIFIEQRTFKEYSFYARHCFMKKKKIKTKNPALRGKI